MHDFQGYRHVALLRMTPLQFMTISMETVSRAKSRPRKNQSECSDFPQDYLAI